MSEWLSKIWDAIKIGAPWLTGGLAGALLTYALNQRNARKNQPRISVRTSEVDYSLSSEDPVLKNLSASYAGEAFEKLSYFEISAENVSSRSVKAAPFLLKLSASEARIVDKSMTAAPINRQQSLEPHISDPSAVVWDAGELKPGDSVTLRLLFTPTSPVSWWFRGDDNVEVLSDHGSATIFERDVRNVVAWLALYLLIGAFPFMADAPRGLLVLFSAPYIVRLTLRWRSELASARRAAINAAPIIINGTEARVSVVHDAPSGRSSIDISP